MLLVHNSPAIFVWCQFGFDVAANCEAEAPDGALARIHVRRLGDAKAFGIKFMDAVGARRQVDRVTMFETDLTGCPHRDYIGQASIMNVEKRV